ncbi:hypothetical protein FIBSPDRAFT_609973, partial [Athelia psychrophila]
MIRSLVARWANSVICEYINAASSFLGTLVHSRAGIVQEVLQALHNDIHLLKNGTQPFLRILETRLVHGDARILVDEICCFGHAGLRPILVHGDPPTRVVDVRDDALRHEVEARQLHLQPLVLLPLLLRGGSVRWAPSAAVLDTVSPKMPNGVFRSKHTRWWLLAAVN